MKVTISPKGVERIQKGHAWIFRSDLQAVEAEEAGVATVVSSKGETLYRSRPIASGLGGESMELSLGNFPKGTLLVRMEGSGEAFSRLVAVP